MRPWEIKNIDKYMDPWEYEMRVNFANYRAAL